MVVYYITVLFRFLPFVVMTYLCHTRQRLVFNFSRSDQNSQRLLVVGIFLNDGGSIC